MIALSLIPVTQSAEIDPSAIAEAISGFSRSIDNGSISAHGRVHSVKRMLTSAVGDMKADSLIRLAQLATLRWRKVEPDGQGSFLEQYADTYWQAALPGRGLYVDTTGTQALRGRLQAAFGRPTRNGDAQRRYGYGGSEDIQFE